MSGRSPWRMALARLVRDRWSFASAIVLAIVIFLSFAGGPITSRILGHNGFDQFPYAANADLRPVGPLSHVPDFNGTAFGSLPDGSLRPPPKDAKKTFFLLGADGPLGRDEFIRLLDGGKTSLEIAICSALVALLIGLPLGALGGYFGGFIDAIGSRITETIMAFPLLLFLVFASVQLDRHLDSIGYGWWFPNGVVAEALLIGLFTSFYPTRLVRVQMMQLRSADFVESAEMVGASHWRIIRSHLLPHLVPSLLVWGAIAVGTNILIEVGLSFIGAGVQITTATWGSLLANVWGTILAPSYQQAIPSNEFTPWETIFPSIAILITVVSLNQLAEGLRRALDPREHA